jgi:outer membrane protein OmpA-like peptidoglycan-associated protein
MIRPLLILLLMASPATAQLRDFSCVGTERLDQYAIAVSFARGADRLAPEAIASLTPLAEEAKQMLDRNICVLGFAASPEGGAQTASRLAARRARAVAQQLSEMGVERDRIRAEARTRGFATEREQQGVDRRASARIILLPPP